MNTVSIFCLVAVISYLVGTINFSKIFSWYFRHRDITKIGSGNPGTMNMLRSYGFGLAIFTFTAEVVKAGLTCLIFKTIFPQTANIIYYFAGAFILLGYNFPIWSNFKGGKGVACFAGIFLFSSIWYVALIWFVVCFILFLFIEYPFVISLIYLGALSIATTLYVWLLSVPYAWAITLIIWLLMILTLVRHRSNIKRLLNHCENKIDFKRKLREFFKKKSGEEIISEEEVKQEPEKEIVVEEDKEDKQ